MKKQALRLAAAIGLALASASATAATGDSDVTRATLDNGLRVVIVRDTLAPVITTEMNYLAGSDEVPDGFPGTAHAVEHMMFRGSPGLSKDQLAAIAANMGGAFNADTTQSVTQYYFVAPSQDLDVALHVQSLRMRGVDMDAKEWDKERGAISQEVSRDLSSPDFKFYTQLLGQMFSGTPYAHTPLGTRDSFDKTTAAMLKNFHDTWYAPNNAILVIAGDVDPVATLAKVKQEFGDIARKTLPARPAFDFRPVTAKTVQLPTDAPYGSVYLGYRLPGLTAKDHATAMVLSGALGSQRAALAGMRFDGTALFGGFFDQSMPQAGVGMAVGIFPKGGNPQPVLAKMQSILAEAAAKGIDPALVEAAKRKAIAALEFKKNSVDGLANAWSSALAFEDAESPDAIKAAIEAVTPDAVNALARQTFDPAHAITAILTPESSGKPVAGKGFGGAESFASTPDKPVQLPAWAEQAFAKLEVPKSSLKPVSYTMPNGLRLIVQPETISDTVELFGSIKTNQDLQSAKGDEGVADVLEDLFPFGTEHLNRLQFQEALDAISAHVSAGYDFSLSVPSAHFAEGVKLLADNELHPALPAQAFPVVQQQTAGVLAGQLQSPDFLLQLGLDKALLPANDPQLRYPTPQNVMALTLDKVKQYYAQTFRPDLATIVIVGKVDPAQAKQVIEQAFGDWKAAGARPDTDYAAVPANQPGKLHVPDTSAVQDSVDMAQTIAVTYDDPARFAINLGNQVLGGGFYASRLTRDLREKHGLVYTVGVGLDTDKHRSTYKVSFGCDPDKVGAASGLVVQDLKQMQQQPVTDTELMQAKGILLRRIPLGESSFGGIGSQLLTLSQQGKPLDAMTIAGQHYLELTAPEVQKAFAKYVRPDGLVTAVKGPAPKN
ncbi:insulinase family protein [Rhodanobacter sp. 7MK24]|uniref:M16 family metallopeptidase n=1 Tax=Rhodanobacter sp. 7MK24 TaxID=2775922 RepID=UPI0017837749|nr:pitrilysin family protein [Rhodanobacter sp. 7MK24]MBD8878969.1 insulinase family protein [Rhodanobacter sp. 7MK24]